MTSHGGNLSGILGGNHHFAAPPADHHRRRLGDVLVRSALAVAPSPTISAASTVWCWPNLSRGRSSCISNSAR